MIGTGIGPVYQALTRRSAAGPVLYDFRTGVLPAALSFTRVGAGTRHNASGQVGNVAADQPRFDHGPDGGAPTALLYEPAATNFVQYASDPGNNAGWIESTTHNGLTISRIATGSLGDLAYADYRVQGTASSSFTDKFYLSGPSRTAAGPGQTFTGSAYVQVIAGSTANIGKFTVSVIEENAAMGFLGQSISDWTVDFPQLTRIVANRTLADPSAGYVRLALVLSSMAVGASIDITLRVAGPQLEEAAAPSSFVQVPADAAMTRGADRLFLPTYSGERQITVTFADAGTEVLNSTGLVGGELPRFATAEIETIEAVPL